jgi:hypothetical protein
MMMSAPPNMAAGVTGTIAFSGSQAAPNVVIEHHG